MRLTVKRIAGECKCDFRGDGAYEISGIAPLDQAGSEHISFLANPKYANQLENSRAGCIILSPAAAEKWAGNTLIAENPYYVFALVSQLFHRPEHTRQGVSSEAILEDDVFLGEDVTIYPYVYVSRGARIGDRAVLYPHVFVGENSAVGADTLIYPHVTVREKVTIGERVIVHSGTVIGSDGYGFATHEGIHHKVPQVGEVIIEDDVELGASVTIDRGTLGPTIIGKGTKFDNQVHIAHNVSIGENSLIIAQSGIAGSTKVGKSVTIAGQSGVVGHVTVGDYVMIGAKTAVTKSVPSGKIVSGMIPARDHKKSLRSMAALSRLPDLVSRVSKLEKIIRENGLDPDSENS